MLLVHEQTILKMNEIYVYKRLCIETTSFPLDLMEVAAFTGLKTLKAL